MPSTGTFTFTTAHWMIMGVHSNTTNLGTITFPTTTTGLAELLAVMKNVTDLTNTGPTTLVKFPNLARGKLHQDILRLFRHELGGSTSRTNNLRTLADLHLNIMDDRPQGNIGHGQTIPQLDINIRSGLNNITDLNAMGGKDIPFFTIRIKEEGNIGGAVWVILY